MCFLMGPDDTGAKIILVLAFGISANIIHSLVSCNYLSLHDHNNCFSQRTPASVIAESECWSIKHLAGIILFNPYYSL